MGVATAGQAYDLTRRQFGRAAGFAGGLVLVLTPATVAVSRHNNPDALLARCRIRWVVIGGDGGRGQNADRRTGSTRAMAAVATACDPVASVEGPYDCSQSAVALREAV